MSEGAGAESNGRKKESAPTNAAGSSSDATCAERSGFKSRCGVLYRWLPRPEMILLIVSLLWTIGAKARVMKGQRPESLIGSIFEVTLPDFAFFLGMAALFSGMYMIGLKRSAARVSMLLAGFILLWSVLNAAWLLSTSVQLQPGVLAVLLKDPVQFWPTVQAHLAAKPTYAIPIILTICGAAVWFIWRVCRPVNHVPRRVVAARVFFLSLVIAIAAIVTHEIEMRAGRVGYSGQVMGFSSHWAAMLSTFGLNGIEDDVTIPQREVPRAGQRQLVAPAPNADKPNVVIIFLESVSYISTSLGDPEKTNTPTLERLAAEGVEFTRTYVPVPQTNKAFFTALTGCTPDIASDYAESVLVDEPYESLATILKARGYRSGFFQMADGAFECGPGLFANMGFDWAWFFENLQDESARVGYLSADDFKMIDPMFEWVDNGKQPFLLSMITTVAHDPYNMPEWFEPNPSEKRHARYLRAVEYSDLFVAAIIEQLEKRGLLDNTLLCVLGDHGDSFRADARRGRWVPYEEVVRVPWVIRWPGHIDPATTVDSTSAQLDVTPTVLTLLGYDVSAGKFDGHDALAPASPDRRLYFTAWYEDSPTGYIEGDRKFVYWPYTDTLFEFNLASDPEEKKPMTVIGPDRAVHVKAIQEWRERSQFVISARRFREKTLYDHWQTMSSGRSAWAYFTP